MDYNKYFMDLLSRLVSIPSQSQNEEDCAAFLAGLLRDDLGMEARLERVEGKSCSVTAALSGSGPKACGSPAEKKQRRLLLGGHIDTVSAAEGWDTDPLRLTVKGDRGYGLGAADMKGGLAAQVTVLKKLIDEGACFAGEIEFTALCDEERHSIGANDYVQRKRSDERQEIPDFAVFAEPHYDNIVTGATGKVLLSLEIRGTAGHAANPETGVNAIDCTAAFLDEINRVYTPQYLAGRRASHCILRIGSKYGGYSLNIPEVCTALLNKQLYVGEEAEAFIGELRELYTRRVGKGDLSISREAPYYPSYELDRSHPDLRMLLKLLEDGYESRPELRLNQSVSDGNILYTQLGIPTLLFGPEGHDYHKANEYIVLSTAYRYMDMLYDFIQLYFKRPFPG